MKREMRKTRKLLQDSKSCLPERICGTMGQYPVIALTLKSAKQSSFDSAYYKLKEEIAEGV